MCENCNKDCYQIAYINDKYQDTIRGLCIEPKYPCDKKLVKDDIIFCTCNNNPEKLEYKY